MPTSRGRARSPTTRPPPAEQAVVDGHGGEGGAAPPAPVLRRVASAVGPIGLTRRLGGQGWGVTAGGRPLVIKLGAGVLDEADGLRRLAAAPRAPPVPAER